MVEDAEGLIHYDFSDISIEEDPRLNFGSPHLNMIVYKSTGGAGNIDFGLANPHARTHDGHPIESWDSITARTGYTLREAVRRITDDGKRFGIVTSHATVTEPTLIHLINSGREVPVGNAADIGGTTNEEEHAILTIDRTNGGLYSATLNYKGQGHTVDLQKLLN